MSKKSVLMIQGGWAGHQPEAMAKRLSSELESLDFTVEISSSLEVLDDKEKVFSFDVISPCWTMGTLSPDQTAHLSEAVRAGAGLAGVHGGMGDAFRGNLDYEWMVGGHFVGHPHVGPYTVSKTETKHGITARLPDSFEYDSEQYYMMVDPVIEVHAETIYEYEGQSCRMPVVWTRQWGKGNVFYSALGHQVSEFAEYPHVLEATLRGFQWAAGLPVTAQL